MAESRKSEELFWCFPRKRGIIPLDHFHVPKKLGQLFGKYPFDIKVDTAFCEVVLCCAEITEKRSDTWINPTLASMYSKLYDMGYAHSVECWRDGVLAGGLFGISIGGTFFGESMFSHVTNASKIALIALVIILREGGYQLLDTQFVNAHLKQFGAEEIPSAQYLRLLRRALEVDAVFQVPEAWNLGR